jgi:hypothetical protein
LNGRTVANPIASRKSARTLVVLLAFGLVLVLAACSKAKPPPPTAKAAPKDQPRDVDDLARVCEGKVFADNPAYTKHADPKTPSHVGVFAKFLDEAAPAYREQNPAALEMMRTGSPNGSKLAELAMCIDVRRGKPSGSCSGKPAYEASYHLRLLEVRSGKVLETRDFELNDLALECRVSERELEGKPKEFRVPGFTPMVWSILEPLEPAGVVKELPRVHFPEICGGLPLIGAEPYVPGKPARVAVWLSAPDSGNWPVKGIPELPPSKATTEEQRPENFQVVACVFPHRTKKVKTCEFSGGHTLELYDGAYEVRMIESRTGRLVAAETFPSPKSSTYCPLTFSFPGEKAMLVDSASPALAKLIDKYVRGQTR